ncbi:alkylation response protein AidB-like acyl-CoA dehydrogenase [Caulobacter ginsengisoli]|uniref:Alkylation response protein AidB-like acyl-CoA dehydrogenase n=1 Tax=Caulobacter ginsengisoli TaxID=400775 RepID=A0ABU0IN03_9CAUL|nr:acyl-CoA dehydrogenase family protein [Caulobacter ginsengisoli]MDQ0463391.1 alkylation response protein AidB-like acyl-CoA dehydrogenase [Caulobacter ginsengisoli]
MIEPEHVTALRDQLRRFVTEKAPREKRREWDRTHSFPCELFDELAALGLCGLTIDEEYGGSGQDILAAVAAIEELCRAGAFLAGPFIHCAFYGGLNIGENGSPEQKAELLPRLARGELTFAYGLSEPDVGGDLSAVKTRARIEGDTVILNGAKRWCTGADFADYIYCLVRSDPDAPARQGLSFLLVPTKAAGVTLAPIEHSNLRYTLSSDVFFDDVRLPLSSIVGGTERWNQGWKMLAGRALDIEKLEIAACAFGIAQAAVEEAWTYAQERVQFGKPISGHQAVRHSLVEARTKLEACRHMLYHAARLADAGQPCAVETSMAKLFIGDTVVEIALICQRVMGAYAMSDAYDMERHVRDLLGMPIVGGSSNMQKNNIAALLRLPG